MEQDPELEALCAQYRQTILEKLSTVQGLIEKVKSTPSEESLKALRHSVHKIAGSASLYGYPAVGLLCRSMDKTLLEQIEKKAMPDHLSLDAFYTTLSQEYQK